MSDNDKVFSGSIPEFYDRYLVPLIFEDFAHDLAQRVTSFAPDKILETAAGSGVVTRALAPRLSSHSQYTVSDLNQPMLDHAKNQQNQRYNITWQQADALDLPFAAGEFDMLLCQFGVMFFPDRIAGYAEALRILKPGGHFIFNVWDHLAENDFARIVTKTAAGIFPNDPPEFLARTPHGYHDIALIHQELEQAGFSNISIITKEAVSAAPSARHPAVAYCQGTPLRNEIESRDADLLSHVTDEATKAIAAQHGTGPVAAKIQGHVITATK